MSYPARHTPFDEARDRGRALRLLLRDRRPLDREAWDRIGAGLTQGDPLADAVVAWLGEVGARGGRERFDRAARLGIDALSPEEQAASAPLVALFRHVASRPAWLDDDLLALGGLVLDRCHPVPYYVLRNMGLMAGYTWRDLNRPLVMTGALSKGATRRVAETMKWTSDCIGPGGLAPGGAGWVSTLHVRLIHASVRARLSQHRDWDADDMGLPVNQTDMAATWLAFSVVLLLGARALGVSFTRREALGVMHLWKYACWLMGVDEAWLTDDEHAGRRLLFEILSTYRGADDSSAALGRALLDSTEQLAWPAPRELRWRLERERHLSTALLFVGPGGLRRLGLPVRRLPWYPLVSFAPNRLRTALLRLPSPVRARAEARGRAAREALVRAHFLGDAPGLRDQGAA